MASNSNLDQNLIGLRKAGQAVVSCDQTPDPAPHSEEQGLT